MAWSPMAQSLLIAYTAAGNYTVRFTAEGLDGKSAEKTFSISVSGSVIFRLLGVTSEPHE